MKNCKFCSDYRFIKKLDKKSETAANCDPESKVSLRHLYKVAMVVLTKRRFRGESNWGDGGRTIYHSYPIKYCPMCGRRLR